jgi:hypothetical protein
MGKVHAALHVAGAGRNAASPGVPEGMVLLRHWRRRRVLRAWARGELEFAGALRRQSR